MSGVTGQETSGATATITRTKLYRRVACAGSQAWKWLYDVNGLPTRLEGFDTLKSAERIAKEYGATNIVRAWESRS